MRLVYQIQNRQKNFMPSCGPQNSFPSLFPSHRPVVLARPAYNNPISSALGPSTVAHLPSRSARTIEQLVPHRSCVVASCCEQKGLHRGQQARSYSATLVRLPSLLERMVPAAQHSSGSSATGATTSSTKKEAREINKEALPTEKVKTSTANHHAAAAAAIDATTDHGSDCTSPSGTSTASSPFCAELFQEQDERDQTRSHDTIEREPTSEQYEQCEINPTTFVTKRTPSVTILGIRSRKFFGKDGAEEGLRLFDQLKTKFAIQRKIHLLIGLEKWQLQKFLDESKKGEIRHRRNVQHLREWRHLFQSNYSSFKHKPEFLPLYQVALLEKYPISAIDFEESMFYDSLSRASFAFPVEAIYWFFYERLILSTNLFTNNDLYRALMLRRVPNLAKIYFYERAHYMAAKCYLYCFDEADDNTIVMDLAGGVKQFDEKFRWTDGNFYVRGKINKNPLAGARLVRVSSRNTDVMLKSPDRIREWFEHHSSDGAFENQPEEVTCVLRKDGFSSGSGGSSWGESEKERLQSVWAEFDEYGRRVRENKPKEKPSCTTSPWGGGEQTGSASACTSASSTAETGGENQDENPHEKEGEEEFKQQQQNKSHHVMFVCEEMFQPLILDHMEKIDSIQTAMNILQLYEDRCYKQPPCLHFWWYAFIFLYMLVPLHIFVFLFVLNSGFRIWDDFFSYKLIDGFSRN
ncbi:unnamed protein product [Amoebophrya sp. A120]|nr:unnamed protein product [Amoebophrya sp. A120]|eukprot:GSA120T00010149001.1